MKPTKTEKISFDEAATKLSAKVFNDLGEVVKEFPVWKGAKDGRYYSDESEARINNATHHSCECGNEKRVGHIRCEPCEAVKVIETYQKMPVQAWGEFPVCIYNDDTYFFEESDFLEWCEDNEIEPKDIRLCGTDPNHPWIVETDFWADIMPDNVDDPFSKDFHKKLDELNEVIKKHTPISYSQAKRRVVYSSAEEANKLLKA